MHCFLQFCSVTSVALMTIIWIDYCHNPNPRTAAQCNQWSSPSIVFLPILLFTAADVHSTMPNCYCVLRCVVVCIDDGNKVAMHSTTEQWCTVKQNKIMQ